MPVLPLVLLRRTLACSNRPICGGAASMRRSGSRAAYRADRRRGVTTLWSRRIRYCPGSVSLSNAGARFEAPGKYLRSGTFEDVLRGGYDPGNT